MNYKYYIADIFTHKPFSGAQVAVFPEAEGLNNQQMLLVARELNLSETVFLFQDNENKASWKMKIFTPLRELDYAGHPIIAAAYILASIGKINRQEPYSSVKFVQNTGALDISVSWKDDKPIFVQYANKVKSTVDYYTPTEAEIAGFLGFDQAQIDQKKYRVRLVSAGYPYLVVPLFYYETVRKARFNYNAWSQSNAPQTGAQEILLFSPKTPNADSEFALRLVGPNIGLRDDPPVGTALSAFAAYLCSFDHLQKGTYAFAVERGEEKTRRSVINLEMDHKGEDVLPLRIGGEAVMMAEGAMEVPAL